VAAALPLSSLIMAALKKALEQALAAIGCYWLAIHLPGIP